MSILIIMTEERFWLLVSLKMSGEASEAELQELEAQLQQEPALRLKVSIMEQNWRAKKGWTHGEGRCL